MPHREPSVPVAALRGLLHQLDRWPERPTNFNDAWDALSNPIARYAGEEPEAAACKWVSIREENRETFDLPTVFSILIYTHPETGFPLAICEA